MGTLTIHYGDLVIGSCDLLAAAPVEAAGSTITDAQCLDVAQNDGDKGWKKWLTYGMIILLVLLAIAVVVYVILRAMRNAKIRAQQRRRAREHKRSR